MPDMDKISRGEAIALIKGLAGSGGGGTGITDVQVNGTSVVTDGVANVPVASGSTYGVIYNANSTIVKSGSGYSRCITPTNQHESAFYGLAKIAGADEKNSTLPAGQYTPAAKSAISTMLHAPETVTGTTPTITALAGVQYVCGEVATLDITLPASGCVDIRFESGSTPTVLTITPPTGVTVKWAGGFDPTALDANTVYEINIADGLGVAASWT